MNLTESYKRRLQVLAGIITEVLDTTTTDQERNIAFQKSNERINFSKDLMAKAIREGWEIGMLFQSSNEKYKMAVPKYRIIYPIAMGTSKKSNTVVRAFHKIGQSESVARTNNKRSAEARDEWRLFKTSNIKKMWFTGNFFQLENPLLGKYKKNDKGMIGGPEIESNSADILNFQNNYNTQVQQAKKPQPKTITIKNEPVAKEPQIKKVPAVKTTPKVPNTGAIAPIGTVKPIGTTPTNKNTGNQQK